MKSGTSILLSSTMRSGRCLSGSGSSIEIWKKKFLTMKNSHAKLLSLGRSGKLDYHQPAGMNVSRTVKGIDPHQLTLYVETGNRRDQGSAA